MQFYSLTNPSYRSSFKEATLIGQSPDGGLFFPCYIPKWNTKWVEKITTYSTTDIALHVMRPYVGTDIKEEELHAIITKTFTFDIPLHKLHENLFVLELFHGPTMAFKDVGARFLSSTLDYFAKELSKKIVVLVATSGDTGGAVVSAFEGLENVEVVILYPKRKVSPLQEKQLSSPHKNVHTLEIEGSFDDCQDMVKLALKAKGHERGLHLTSANSINISRWLPQQIYYLLAYKSWIMKHDENNKKSAPFFCVPSGNAGNIAAGALAHQSGMPASGFIAACNANNVITRYLKTGKYDIQSAIPTLSNAMDIGAPNNFDRIKALFENQYDLISKLISSYSTSDAETLDIIKHISSTNHYILDPHTAVGYGAWKKHHESSNNNCILLSTAHPVKFANIIEKATGKALPMTKNVEKMMQQEKHTEVMEANAQALQQWMKKKLY